MKTKKDRLKSILTALDEIGGIKGSAVISVDGLPISSNLKGDEDIGTFAAMSAAMQGAADTAASELNQGELRQIIVDADEGKIIAISAGKNAILVILTTSDINLGLALLELGRASGQIADLLG